MGELWVIRGGQARAVLLLREGRRSARGGGDGVERRGEGRCGGSVVVLAWCYPHQPVGGGGGLGWSICRAVASATHHATSTYTALQRRRRRKEKIVIGDTIVSRKGRGKTRTFARACVRAISRVKSNTFRWSVRSVIISTSSRELRVISLMKRMKRWLRIHSVSKYEGTGWMMARYLARVWDRFSYVNSGYAVKFRTSFQTTRNITHAFDFKYDVIFSNAILIKLRIWGVRKA